MSLRTSESKALNNLHADSTMLLGRAAAAAASVAAASAFTPCAQPGLQRAGLARPAISMKATKVQDDTVEAATEQVSGECASILPVRSTTCTGTGRRESIEAERFNR